MSIYVNKNTRVICQGITGKSGSFHTKGCKDYGTQMVGGVTPGKGGTDFEGTPIFDTVEEAVKQTGANAKMIFVPSPFAALAKDVTSHLQFQRRKSTGTDRYNARYDDENGNDRK